MDLEILHFFNGSDNIILDDIMATLTAGYTWIPLYVTLIYLIIKNNETMAQIMLALGAGILCVIITDGISDGILKPMIARLRPTEEPLVKYTIKIVYDIRGGGLYSFPSAHAANTMGIAVLFCWLVRSKKFCTVMIIWSLLNCWTRLYLGVHYPSDIVVGIICGLLVGTSIFFIYRKIYFKISPRLHYISTQYTKSGYDYNDIDVVISIFIMTIVYAILKAVIVAL